jgi:hypothetical protein
MKLTTDNFPAVLGHAVFGLCQDTLELVFGELVYFNAPKFGGYGVRTVEQRERGDGSAHHCEAVFHHIEAAEAYVAKGASAQRDPHPVPRPHAFWMVVNIAEREENTFTHLATEAGWTLPNAHRPGQLHETRAAAESELLRLAQKEAAGCFVLVEAVAWAEPRERMVTRPVTEFFIEPLPV